MTSFQTPQAAAGAQTPDSTPGGASDSTPGGASDSTPGGVPISSGQPDFVAACRTDLDRIASTPLDGQPEVFARVHGQLQAALADVVA